MHRGGGQDKRLTRGKSVTSLVIEELGVTHDNDNFTPIVLVKVEN